MKLRLLDGLVGAVVLVGLAWAWPRTAPQERGASTPASVVQRAERVRTPLPTRTAPDVHARAHPATRVSGAPALSVPAAAAGGATVMVTSELTEADGSRPVVALVVSPDCGLSARITEGVLTTAMAPGTCTFIAQRASGLLRHESEPFTATLDTGDEWVIALAFPPGETGGLGATLNRDARGVRLGHVMPGSAADQAGLMAGDVIATVEGQDVTRLSLDALVRELTGPVGSIVDVTLWPGDDPDAGPLAATLERQFLAQD